MDLINQGAVGLDVLLLGGPQSGTSSTGNTLLGSREFPSRLSPGAVTTECRLACRTFPAFLRRQGEEVALRLGVLDTPACPGALQSPELVKQAIAEAVGQAFEGGPHTLVLVLRADVPYCDADAQLAQLTEDLFGPEWGNHALLVLTHSDRVKEAGMAEEEYLRLASGAFGALLARVERRHQFVDNTTAWRHTERGPVLESLLLVARKNTYRRLQLKSI